MKNSLTLLWDQTMPLLRLNGPGSRSFLHGQTTTDVQAHENGAIFQSCWLSATGRLKALLEVRLDDQGADVLVLGGDAETLEKGFSSVIFPADQVKLKKLKNIRRVQVLDVESSNEVCAAIWLETDSSLPKHMQELEKANSDQFDYWRLNRGLPIGSGELNSESNPLELGLANLISFSKGCYLGQETISKVLKSGKLKKELRYWESISPIQAGEKLLSLDRDLTAPTPAGVISSALELPNGDGFVGLAMIRSQSLGEEKLFLSDCRRSICFGVPKGFVNPMS